MEATKESRASNRAARNLLIGALVLGAGGALLLGWNWLAAAGFASLIVGMLPCLAMCALGICASRMGTKDNHPR